MNATRITQEANELASVLERVSQTYNSMSPGQKRVAEYVLHHQKALAFAPVAEIAKQAATSTATVVRFADRLGLNGYSDLQRIARSSLRGEFNTVSHLEESPTTTKNDVFDLAVRQDIENLQGALSLVNRQDFLRATKLLDRANKIHLIGLRSSFGIIAHFEFYLKLIGRNAGIIKPGIGDFPEQVAEIQKKDVCVLTTFRRYSRDALEILRSAKAGGAATIVITDSELAPARFIADLTLVVPVKFPAFFESRVAVLSLVNALVYSLAFSNRDKTLEALRRREALWGMYDIYLDNGKE